MTRSGEPAVGAIPPPPPPPIPPPPPSGETPVWRRPWFVVIVVLVVGMVTSSIVNREDDLDDATDSPSVPRGDAPIEPTGQAATSTVAFVRADGVRVGTGTASVNAGVRE